MISVIIPVYNRWQILREALTMLTYQQIETDEFEVVIVDDGSTEDITQLVESLSLPYPFTVIRKNEHSCENRGAVRNLGVKHAKGEFLFFMDCDIFCTKDALQIHLDVLKTQPRVVSVGYHYDADGIPDSWPIDINPSSPFLRPDIREHTGIFENSSSRYPWLFCYMGNVAISKRLFLDSGGFSETFTFWGCEDIEFAYRLFHDGAKFVFNQTAQAVHYPHLRLRNNREAHQKALAQIFSLHPNLDMELFVSGKKYEMDYYLELVDLIKDREKADPFEPLPLPFSPELVLGSDGIYDVSARYRTNISPIQGENSWHLLGLRIPFADKAVKTVILSGYWRFLPIMILNEVFTEALRVSENVYVRCLPVKNSQKEAIPFFDGTEETLRAIAGEMLNIKQIVPGLVHVSP